MISLPFTFHIVDNVPTSSYVLSQELADESLQIYFCVSPVIQTTVVNYPNDGINISKGPWDIQAQ